MENSILPRQENVSANGHVSSWRQRISIPIVVGSAVILAIIIIVFVIGIYFLNSDKNKLTQEVVVPIQMSSSPVASPLASPVSTLKTYINKELQFSFQYPSEWMEHSGTGEVLAWFSGGEGELSEKLQVRFVAGENNPISVAQADITKNNCVLEGGSSPDKVISSGDTFTMYVLNCSMSSERYVDAVKVSGGILVLEYHDDFDSSADVTQKTKELVLIGKSVKIFDTQNTTVDTTTLVR